MPEHDGTRPWLGAESRPLVLQRINDKQSTSAQLDLWLGDTLGVSC